MEVIRLENISKCFKLKFPKSEDYTLKSAFIKFIKGKLRRDYKEFFALKNITFSVKKGTTLGIIGENGSGKSTLLRIIAKILKPTTGSVFTFGKLSALIELCAGFHPEFTGRENIFLNGAILGFSKKEIKKKIDEIIEFSELKDFIDQPVKFYSSGMFLRLGFSIAVSVDPDILLLDEILAVGDENFASKCKDRLNEFKRKGKTIILVSHDLETIKNWCDRAILLDKGEIKAFGSPEYVVDKYIEKIRKKEETRLEKGERKNLKRWGSKDVEIFNVKMLDLKGKERYVFDVGEDVIISFEYYAKKIIEDPVFGIAIVRSDGLNCYGTNTDIENIKIGKIHGKGKVKVHIKKLMLLEGSYFLDVAVHRRDGFAYDYHSRMYKFLVKNNLREVGVLKLNHTWIIQ